MKKHSRLGIAMRVTALTVALCFSAACATPSGKIGASYVSPVQYNSYSCEQLSQEYTRISGRVIELSRKQDGAAARDAIGMAVGLVVFWPALILLAGSKGEPEELARLRGECNAIEECAIEKNCLLAQQIADEKKKLQEVAKQESEKSNKELAHQSPWGASN